MRTDTSAAGLRVFLFCRHVYFGFIFLPRWDFPPAAPRPAACLIPAARLTPAAGWPSLLAGPCALTPHARFNLFTRLSRAAFYRKGNGLASQYCPEFVYHILLGSRNLAESPQGYLFCGHYLNSRTAELLREIK